MKVLIISHNPITTYESMGKTLKSLFSSFSKEELCQLYIYPTVPDIDFCNSYYRITDISVLKSFYKFNVKGEEVFYNENQHNLFENETQKNFYSNKKNQQSFRLFLRDTMWKLSHWFNKDLKQWIERERPDCIFVATGLSVLIYNIAIKISKYYGIKLVSYFCDDYYFAKNKKRLFDILHYWGLRKKIRKIIKFSSFCTFINDMMNSAYSKEFNIDGLTTMTASSFEPIEGDSSKSIERISYFGNLRLGRYDSLCKLGKVIDDLNTFFHKTITIDVFSPENDDFILKKLSEIKCINFRGFVTGSDYLREFDNAECFLHCESFEKKYTEITRYSISTKIPDILASGKPIFAFGPTNIACISYLKVNDIAFVSDNEADIKDELTNLLSDSQIRKRKMINAYKLCKKNHDLKNNSWLLKERIRQLGE